MALTIASAASLGATAPVSMVIFIYGQVASGKLTIARELAERTGMALFHNHPIVACTVL
jgi:hypothetical protein